MSAQELLWWNQWGLNRPFCVPSFLSTSRDPNKAFSATYKLIITIPKGLHHGARNISRLSNYPEEEILFKPYSVFIITAIEDSTIKLTWVLSPQELLLEKEIDVAEEVKKIKEVDEELIREEDSPNRVPTALKICLFFLGLVVIGFLGKNQIRSFFKEQKGQ